MTWTEVRSAIIKVFYGILQETEPQLTNYHDMIKMSKDDKVGFADNPNPFTYYD